MPQYNTTGIVLRRTIFGETDNILTLFTRERGKISAIAKGARKPLSRTAGASEVLSCSRFNLASGKSLEIVTQAEVKNAFPALRRDLSRLAQGQYMAEVLSHFVVEEDPHPELFALLRAALLLLERVANPDLAARWFDLRLLELLGYAPDLGSCAVCHASIPGSDAAASTDYGLSASLGGALCELHAHPRTIDDHSALTFDALDYLQHLNDFPVERIRAVLTLPAPSLDTAALARLALRRYIRYRLDRDLKSLAFLDGLAA